MCVSSIKNKERNSNLILQPRFSFRLFGLENLIVSCDQTVETGLVAWQLVIATQWQRAIQPALMETSGINLMYLKTTRFLKFLQCWQNYISVEKLELN